MIVVDAHVHFWDPAALHYPWLDGVPALERAFLPRDYPDDVQAMVFVEANCAPSESAEEIAFLERLGDPRIMGTVAYVDLLDEDGRASTLDRLSNTPRVVGVRHNIQGTPRGTCLDPRFVRGVQAVGTRGFVFDLCATADQLADVAAIVGRCPGTQLALDHCGKPAIRNDEFDDWAHYIERIASFDNVSCKLSGLLTEARADQRDARSIEPYVRHVTDCFGPTRLLYGSDWPVSTLAGGAVIPSKARDLQFRKPQSLWRSIVADLTSAWTTTDRQRLFAENAIGLYRLPLNANH
jgi:predicted TIM-barrel fold metal-dependent hydrolase